MGNECCRKRERCWKRRSNDGAWCPSRHGTENYSNVVKMSRPKSPELCAVHWPYESFDGRPKAIGNDVLKLKKWFAWATRRCPGGQASGWSSRSWKNGLAIAAMISKAAPDKFNFKKLRDDFTSEERIRIAMAFFENDLGVPRIFEMSDFFKRRDNFVDGHLLRNFLTLVQPKIDECIFELASTQRTSRKNKKRRNEKRRAVKKKRRLREVRPRKPLYRRRVSTLPSPSSPAWYALKSPIAMESDSDFDDFLWIQALTPHKNTPVVLSSPGA